jgi:hypothetical protein
LFADPFCDKLYRHIHGGVYWMIQKIACQCEQDQALAHKLLVFWLQLPVNAGLLSIGYII